MSDNDTKQRLLLATIASIERFGLGAATSRVIAAEAGANVAAVNYHFGSKARLIELALQLTITNGMADFEAILLDHARPFRPRLHAFFVAVLAGVERYPNITRAHLHSTIIGGDRSNPYIQRLSALVSAALDGVGADDLPLGRQESARRIETGLRSALMLGIAPRMFEVTPSGSCGVEEEAERLVALTVNY